MEIKFTPDQTNAIKAKGTVLVSAAAGSGKTAVLTERVVSRICDDINPISADKLLVVTFTNASALEMRIRITKRLEEKCRENPNNTYLLKQRMLLQNAKICTIDAFCIDLVRKNFGVLGIKPNFNVAEESQTDILREKIVKSVISKYFSSKNEDFDLLASSLGIDKGDKGLKEAILKVYDFSLCMAEPEKWLNNAVANYSTDDFNANIFVKAVYNYASTEIGACIDKARFILREIVDTEFQSKCFVPFSELLDYLSVINALISQNKWNELYFTLINTPKINWGKFSKVEDVKFKDFILSSKKDIYDRIDKILKKMIGDQEKVTCGLKFSKRSVSMLVEVVKIFSDEYFKELNNKNIFTFAHIEQLAIRLLCEQRDGSLVPSELSKSIRKEYMEVLVDEYQDNNNLQDALFYALSDEGKHLFMVGDVKQSIYGFRNANPDNFLKHKDTFAYYDGVVSPSKVILKSNFRSRDGVCDFVNAFCSAIMQNETCSMEYTEDEVLVPGALYPKNDTSMVDICVTDIHNTDFKREQADAESVANYIESVLKEKPFIKNGDDGLRRAEYGDFAILLRSPKSRADFYTEALKKRNIPVSYESGQFYETPEVTTVVSFLRVLNNPTSDIALTSLLMSVVFGFTADEIARLKVTYGHKSMYANVCAASANGDTRFKTFLDKISSLKHFAVTLPVAKLINEIYKSTHLLEIMSAFDDGDKRHENLLRLVSLASKFDSMSDEGLIGFIEYFDRMTDSDTKHSASLTSKSNTVKIMSIHGSKGLQFPVCIVADCGGRFNLLDINNSLIVNGDYGIGMKYVLPGENIRTTTIAREAMSFIEKKKLIAEEIRLFYVAMTRAEERLMLSITSKNIVDDIISAAASLGSDVIDTQRVPAPQVISSKGYYNWILMSALMQVDGEKLGKICGVEPIGVNGQAKFKTIIINPCEEENVVVREVQNDKKVTKNLVDNRVLEQIRERFEFIYPYKNEINIPSKLAVTELVKGDKSTFSFVLKPQFMSKAGLTPAERGTAAHKFFQYADYNKAKVDADMEIKRLAEWEYISMSEAESIDRKSVTNFFESDVFSRIDKALAVFREYKFMIEYPYLDSKTIVQGIADCVFEEHDGLVILDFKTDNIDNISLLSERYAQQLKVYKYAITEIFKKPVKECVLYSLKLGESISIEV